MMNLNKLHLLMIGHKYHYIDGYTNSQCINLVFSKGYNGGNNRKAQTHDILSEPLHHDIFAGADGPA